MADKTIVRFWSKVNKTSTCWNWTAAKSILGYGEFKFNGKRVRAHRFSYQLVKGVIPDGLDLDHLCRNTSCVNPEHLEAVTTRENLIRSSITLTTINSKKTHCPKGHLYSEDNLIKSSDGKRKCKKCQKIFYKNSVRKKIISNYLTNCYLLQPEYFLAVDHN